VEIPVSFSFIYLKEENIFKLWEHGWTEYMGSRLLRGRRNLQVVNEEQKVAARENWHLTIKPMLIEEHEI